MFRLGWVSSAAAQAALLGQLEQTVNPFGFGLIVVGACCAAALAIIGPRGHTTEAQD